jgi:methionyl-tRNA formyltransferase
MRVVITTRYAPVFLGFHATLVELGHEPVAVLTPADSPFRDELIAAVPEGLEVLLPERRADVAPLLERVRPDLVVCMGFPWKVPTDALAVPPHGWVNGHPSLLPQHRGPIPWAWAIRAGDDEMGITFHRMEPELDSGPILAQRSFPLGDYAEPEELYMRSGPALIDALREALERVAAGEPGTPQAEGGSYESFFADEAVWLDLSRPAREVFRLVWAWQHAVTLGPVRGPLLARDGEVVRVLQASLEESDGATRVDCADGPLWLVRTEPVEDAPPPPDGRS